ncbi:MAG: hypothetical protein Q9169_000243 [Polycauliona sp. 2 TL-2023]
MPSQRSQTTTVLYILISALLCLALGQFPPDGFLKEDVTTIRSPVDQDIVIHFKSPPVGTCTTFSPTQKQYTGYVVLPPRKLAPIQQDYYVNTFFWFIEARTNASTAPLTIYINGGPGSSSMVGLFQEAGPCEVVEVARDKFGTQLRKWGWDRSSNIIFVDQPNQVGISYDRLTNGSLNLLDSTIAFPPSDPPPDQPAYIHLDGTFSSNNADSSANTTEIAAHTMWHMLQGFLSTFPQYNPALTGNNTRAGPVGINLFTESYGGKYGPLFAAYFESQNALRRSGGLPKNKTLEIGLASLGIINGCIDMDIQGRFYPIFANNNTYGIEALSLVDQQSAAGSFLGANGCQQQIQSCRSAVASMDSDNEGDVASVNQLCKNAQDSCAETVVKPFTKSGRSIYDITQKIPSPFPAGTYLEYLNTAEVQRAIGVAVNYTQSNSAIADSFDQTGDAQRGDQISQLSYLLSLGVRVALIYGDRDYVCNWVGGEAVSFAIAAQSPAYSPFYSAGYASIVINSTYVGGMVRQYGNLSFSRIYDAGHLVPAYQPETAFTVFSRVILGTDLSFGQPVDLNNYQTNGTANATYTSKAPESAKPTCWIRDVENTCTGEQKDKIVKGDGVVVNGILYDKESDWHTPGSSVSVDAGYPGSMPPAMTAPSLESSGPDEATTTSVDIPTGVYVATATPSTSPNGSSSRRMLFDPNVLLWNLAVIIINIWLW